MRQIMPIAGAVVGGMFGAPQLGFAIGSMIGNIVDPIEITKFVVVSNTVLRFETDGNDTRDPIVTFSIRSTTNLLLPLAAWDSLPVQSNSRTNEQNYLSLSNPPGFQRYYAVEPLWP